jgi:hypothetical protein
MHKGIARAALVVLMAAAGCQTAAYRGALASARSMKEGPRQLGDFYLGMDFRWSIDRADDYFRPPPGEPVAIAAAADAQ